MENELATPHDQASENADDYDSPWKEAIERYFAEFMAFYFVSFRPLCEIPAYPTSFCPCPDRLAAHECGMRIYEWFFRNPCLRLPVGRQGRQAKSEIRCPA